MPMQVVAFRVVNARAQVPLLSRVPLDGRCKYILYKRGGEDTRGHAMASPDEYLAMSLDLLAKAERETDPAKRAQLEALAESYRRTAGKPELTIEFNLPSKKDGPLS
jgi:hypothetical protein